MVFGLDGVLEVRHNKCVGEQMANTSPLPFSSSLLASPETPPKFAALSVPALPLRNGLPRGGITEIAGLRSSG